MDWPSLDEWILVAVVVAIVYGAKLVPLAGEKIGKALARRGGWKEDEEKE